MNDKFDPNDAIEYIDSIAFSSWVLAQDVNERRLMSGQNPDRTYENMLDDILELLYEKMYERAFIQFIEWYIKYDIEILPNENHLLKEYAQYLQLDSDIVKCIEDLQ